MTSMTASSAGSSAQHFGLAALAAEEGEERIGLFVHCICTPPFLQGDNTSVHDITSFYPHNNPVE